jgi:hypothetical protein
MARHFFATADDLLPVFDLVNRKHPLVYTLMGLHESPQPRTITHGANIPTLRDVLQFPDAMAGPSYLVTLEGTSVKVREVPQNSGRVRYAIDQLINPDSIEFSHGGFFGSEILLYGRYATASNSEISKKLYRLFNSTIAKTFDRVKAFSVGPQAKELLCKGYRLTIGAHSPREYDLSLQ